MLPGKGSQFDVHTSMVVVSEWAALEYADLQDWHKHLHMSKKKPGVPASVIVLFTMYTGHGCFVVYPVLQLLVQGLAEQLLRLPVRFEDAEVPLWADSAADYKDAVGTFRSQVRAL